MGNHSGRWLIVVACLAAGGSQLASAADLRYPVKAPPAVDTLPSWAGFYVGGQLGYGSDSVRWHNLGTSGFFSPLDSFTRDRGSGIIGGGQAGYNFQTNRLVLGLEGSLSAADFDRRFGSPYFPTDTWSSKVTWLGTITGRVGIGFDQVLPYLKGGLAVGNVDTSIQNTALGIGTSSSATHWGWTAGGGVEFKVAPKFSLGLEYMYTDLGRRNDISGPTTPGGTESYSVGARSQSLMARFNYLFGWK